ncbi:uncharacterized protein LOC131221069 isoform X4 [Magnolia sinica]|uniref:uncharacterized protein LOC131221069 isoform X4 n=1 Tax=Magnolia sinica TaxID=86752 RepID=UPI00265A2C82|nr:uncharacterized protein LOC131221069 isoform X4 [Magnolia sinica]
MMPRTLASYEQSDNQLQCSECAHERLGWRQCGWFNIMTLSEAGLRKKVKILELQESEKIKLSPDFLSKLDSLLHDAYGVLRPRPNDYKLRQDLVQVFNMMVGEIHGNVNGFPNVEAFGSFIMDMFTAKSDLDLSINFSNDAAEFPRDKMISALKKFAKRLYVLQRGGHVVGVQPIMGARVPILKVVDSGTGIECDISVENKDGIARSKILAMVSTIDERFQKLSFLTRDPPILPPFSALFKDGIDITNLENVVRGYQQFGKENKESLAKLFVTLLIKLSSVETLWPHGLCVSTYQGSWISKTWNSQVANMSVEDFTDQSQNTARSVGKAEVQKIHKCIHVTLGRLSSFMKGQIQVPQMKQLLFGPDAVLTPGEPFINSAATNMKRSYLSRDSKPTKKMRYTESARSTKFVDWSQFLPSGGDGPHGPNLATLMPCNQQEHIPTGDNYTAEQWGHWPQKGLQQPQRGPEGSHGLNPTVLMPCNIPTVENQTLGQWPQWPQKGLQHHPTGHDMSHGPNPTALVPCKIPTVDKRTLGQWPHMFQNGLQHTPTGFVGKHVLNPMVQITYNWQGPVPTGGNHHGGQWPQPGAQHIPNGFVGSHGPRPMAQMPYSVQGHFPAGYSQSVGQGAYLYSNGHL